MKKIKIMLTAIMVVAGLSGALAFKAHKFGSTIYCSNTPSPPICPIITNSTYTADPSGNVYCTSIQSAPCTTLSKIRVLN